jgi:hypothetical protein
MPLACALDGSSNYVNRSLTYLNGKFSGTIKTNLCPNKALPVGNPAPSPSCNEQTYPATTTAPTAAGLLGRVGMSISGGVNIYGPFEAGFTLGQACSNNKGQCEAGSDVATCEAQLAYQCGADFKQSMMPDSCGGHAAPYHFHTKLACEYQESASAQHSPLVAVMLDGVGLYGMWEGGGAAPVLDACNGHTGPVPGDAAYGVPTGTAYHYHVTTTPPFTVGCFGPVDSLAACKALYPACASGTVTSMMDRNGTASNYRLFCPCFQHRGTCNADDFPALCGKRSLAPSITAAITTPPPAAKARAVPAARPAVTAAFAAAGLASLAARVARGSSRAS